MPPTHAHPRVVIPGNITVERDPVGAARVLIDGEPFAYAFDHRAGVRTAVTLDELPSLTLTLVAKSVTVTDSYGDDGQGPIVHDPEPTGVPLVGLLELQDDHGPVQL